MAAEYVMYLFLAVCFLVGLGAIFYAVKNDPNHHH